MSLFARYRILTVGLALAAGCSSAAVPCTPGVVHLDMELVTGDGGHVADGGVPTTPTGPGSMSNDPHIQHCLDGLNQYRAGAGAPPLTLDDRLNAFALAGSQELMMDHSPHQHFAQHSNDLFALGFSEAGENQGDPNGWLPGPVDSATDQILKAMMDEGPGGGHHDNIVNPSSKKVGVGLVVDSANRLYFTNDFGG